MNIYTYIGALLMSPLFAFLLKCLIEDCIELYKNDKEKFFIDAMILAFCIGLIIFAGGMIGDITNLLIAVS